MGLYGVQLNAFSVTNLAVTVGMATELSVTWKAHTYSPSKLIASLR